MRKLLYSVCFLLIMNVSALAQWDGWKNLKNPTFTTVTVTGAAIFQGTVTITGTVTMSQAMTSTSTIELTDGDTDSLKFDPSALNVIHYRDGSTDLAITDSSGYQYNPRLVGLPAGVKDTDTYINWAADNPTWVVGNETMVSLLEDGSQDIVELGDDGDIDIKLSAGADGALFAEGSSGNIGISTTTPLRLLDVAGSARIKGTGTVTLTGTIDPTASATVDGVGTLFLTELVIGDQLVVTGENRTVTAIASDIQCTVDAAFTDNANDTSPDKIESHLVITDSGGTTDLVVDPDGNVGIGTASPGGDLQVGDGSGSLVIRIDKSAGGITSLQFYSASVANAAIELLANETFTIYAESGEIIKLGDGVGAAGQNTLVIHGGLDYVGIGAATPRGLLDLDRAALADTMLLVDNDVSGDLDSTILVLADASINKPAGDMQFDVADGGLYKFGENGTDGIQIDAASGKITGSTANNFLNVTQAKWQTDSNDMAIDPDAGSVGILFLGDTGDNDTVRVAGYMDVSDNLLVSGDVTIEGDLTVEGTESKVGEFYWNANGTATTMETANTPIGVRYATVGDLLGFTFDAGGTGAITAYADFGDAGGDTVTVSDGSHGLATGDFIVIRGTTNYNGVWQITDIDGDSFYILDTWVADDGASDWEEPSYLQLTAGTSEEYNLIYMPSTQKAGGASATVLMTGYVNTTAEPKSRSEREFPGTDIGVWGGGCLLTMSAGDRFYLVVQSDNTNDLTYKYGTVRLLQE